jgi:hypothetical protein
MTREELYRVLKNEQGQPLVILPWWGEMRAALADSAVTVVAISARRQDGKTTACTVEALATAMEEPGTYITFLTAAEQQAQSIFARKIRRPAERMLDTLGVPRRHVLITKRSIEFLEFGSKVEVLATSEATTPGRSVRLLICDEARDIPDEVFAALAPSIIASGGKILLASTAGRPRGFFHQVVTEPGDGCRVIRVEGDHNPFADQAKISALARLLTKISPAFAARELRNEFADDDVAALLPAALIEAAVDDGLGELPHHDGPAFAFLDLSRRRDLTSLVCVAREPARRAEAADHLLVVSVLTWDPKASPTREVDFAEVRAVLAQLPARFPRLERLLIDEGSEAGSILPWARTQPAFALKVDGFQATVEKNMALWGALAARFHARTLSLPRHPRLLEELRNVRVEEFALGGRWRVLDSSKRLHRDVSLALGGAVYAAGEAGPEPVGGTIESFAVATGEPVPEGPAAVTGFFGRRMPDFVTRRRMPTEDERVDQVQRELRGLGPGRGRFRMFR